MSENLITVFAGIEVKATKDIASVVEQLNPIIAKSPWLKFLTEPKTVTF